MGGVEGGVVLLLGLQEVCQALVGDVPGVEAWCVSECV